MADEQDSVAEVVEITENNEHDQERIYDLSKPKDIVDLFNDEGENEEKVKQVFSEHLKKLAKSNSVDHYKILFLFDNYHSVSSYHSNQIYEAISSLKNNKDILLVICSNGGQIEPAYLVSKTCKKLKKDKFIVSIPRKAKSAATLISLGADEIHMGLLSELGPIDPQFGGFPALGFSNALQRLAELASEYPGSSEMFSKYLTENLNFRELGYFERINESAAQYAERLLDGKSLVKGYTTKTLADHFTNHYKDHGFVIDADEAVSLLGTDVIKEGTNEYKFGNDVYSFIDFSSFVSDFFMDKRLRYVGSIERGLIIEDNEKTDEK